MKTNTFLNDKKIDGELYAYYQSISEKELYEGNYRTIVKKSSIPNQSEICKKIGIKSPKTLRTRLEYLITKGFITVLKNGDYWLENKEDIYFLIPLKTIQYLRDNCKEHVFKIYVYLGQRHQYALKNGFQYTFSSEELGEHIGIKIKNNARGYEIINNALNLLENSGLIGYVEYFDGKVRAKKLTGFSLEHKSH